MWGVLGEGEPPSNGPLKGGPKKEGPPRIPKRLPERRKNLDLGAVLRGLDPLKIFVLLKEDENRGGGLWHY